MEIYHSLCHGFAVVGACTTAYFLLKFASEVSRLCTIYLRNTSLTFKKYGKWSGKCFKYRSRLLVLWESWFVKDINHFLVAQLWS